MSSLEFKPESASLMSGDKLIAVEVYFGWNVPHEAPIGRFIENDGAGHA